LIPKYATDYYTVSEKAGYWLFGKKIMNRGYVKVINNAIMASNFRYDPEKRAIKREELSLNKSDIVIGLVGNFTKAKNHDFLIDVFNELTMISSDFKLLLIGSGTFEETIKKKCEKLKINKKVIFLGLRNDVDLLLQAMDVFVMPSLFEGMPGAAIEAQASGLPVLLSSNITKEAKICDSVKFLELNDTPKKWAEQIISIYKTYDRKDVYKQIVDSGYDISVTSKEIENQYLRMLENH
jgi:glycosyltransferase involved in cell wall biosynthesis